jgi:regulator of RNase E activity RraB
MPHRTLLALVAAASFAAQQVFAQDLESPSQRAARENADRSVLAALQRNGADLSKAHNIEHFFIARTRKALVPLASQLTSRGFSPQPPSEGKDQRGSVIWTLLATKPTLPSEANILADTLQLVALARQFGVVYDGWGAVAVR